MENSFGLRYLKNSDIGGRDLRNWKERLLSRLIIKILRLFCLDYNFQNFKRRNIF